MSLEIFINVEMQPMEALLLESQYATYNCLGLPTTSPPCHR